MSHYQTFFEFSLKPVNEVEALWLQTLYDKSPEESDNADTDGDSLNCWDFDLTVHKRADDHFSTTICTQDDGGGDIDHVVLFVQLFLKRFRPKGIVDFSWSEGEAGSNAPLQGRGGAVIIRAGSAKFLRTDLWRRQQIRSMQNRNPNLEVCVEPED